MSPDGGGERLLTDSWQDEAPSWSPNGRVVHVLPHQPGPLGHVERLAGRPHRRQRAPDADPAGRLRPRLGPDPDRNDANIAKEMKNEKTQPQGRRDRRRAGADRRLRQEGAQASFRRRRREQRRRRHRDAMRRPGGVGTDRLPGSRADFIAERRARTTGSFSTPTNMTLDDRDRATLDAQAALAAVANPQRPGHDRRPCRRARHPRI